MEAQDDVAYIRLSNKRALGYPEKPPELKELVYVVGVVLETEAFYFPKREIY